MCWSHKSGEPSLAFQMSIQKEITSWILGFASSHKIEFNTNLSKFLLQASNLYLQGLEKNWIQQDTQALRLLSTIAKKK